MIPDQIKPFLQKIRLPKPDSHKGQNGKLLIIGGSELFHAASKWSLDVASHFVDMVFYSSVPSNNDLIQEAKGNFWNGIVVPREEVDHYVEEADCILIDSGVLIFAIRALYIPCENDILILTYNVWQI